MKPIIGLHTPNPRDSTSIYRCWGPWSALKDKFDFYSITQEDTSWNNIGVLDLLFMHRPFTPNHLKLAAVAKRLGRPLWVDYDDDVFNVHISNDNHALYDNNEVRDCLKKILNFSDLITVSTRALADSLSKQTTNKNIIVIENKLPDHLTGNNIGKFRECPPSKRILWRGTKHHEMNLKQFEPAITQAIKNRPDWVWSFYGYRPWYLMEKCNPAQSEHMADSDPFEFFENLSRLHSAIQIIPLIDNEFNRSKSNIALLEGCAYGESLVIAPMMDEWITRPGVLNYSDLESFGNCLERAMNFSIDESYQMRKMSHQYVVENGLVSSFLNQRMDLVSSLLHKP